MGEVLSHPQHLSYTMSSLTRAFTTRRVKQSLELAAEHRAADKTGNKPQRSKTTKGNANALRTQISAPVELIHTTNMLSYNAPDISRSNSTAPSSSNSSRKSSDEDSDSANTGTSSPPTSPEVDAHEDKPEGPQTNHLSCYFVAPGQPKDYVFQDVPPVPAIPKRSPSHTKKASLDKIARQRSVSSMSRESERTVSTKASATFSRSSSSSTGASFASHNSATAPPKPPMPAMAHQASQQSQRPTTSDAHPFRHELAQVSEIAEEFGIKNSALEEEEFALKERGLYKFSAESYLGDVQSLFTAFFQEGFSQASSQPHSRPAAMWI